MMIRRISPSTKLTLSLSKSSISFAKKYAAAAGKSVSSLTEDFFNSLNVLNGLDNFEPKTKKNTFSATPIVSEIAGIIPAAELGKVAENFHVASSAELDYKAEYADYLENKYGIGNRKENND